MAYAKELWNMNTFFHFKNRGPDTSSQFKLIQAYISVLKGIPLTKDMAKLLNEYILSDILDKKVPWERALINVPEAYRHWYKGLEEQGVDLLKPPKIQLSTIHGAKGTECDNVVVCPDLSYKAYNEMMDNPDDEARVFYTAVTRTKENLFILSPSTRYYYEL
jgi:superfamily I DNA/RNA helicase